MMDTATATPDLPPAAEEAPPAASPAQRSRRGRMIVLPVVAALVIILGVLGFNIYWQDAHYVSTDNAQVAGQPVPVGAMSAGRVDAIAVAVGDNIRAGQLLGRVELPTAVRTFQNGQPDLQFLGAADQRLDVTSPIDGVVIAVNSAPGATLPQGQPIVTLLDPTQLWVTANIDENKVSRLRVGQQAEVHLDALGSTVDGQVQDLTPATAGIFSLLPQSNTTTNFTKVSQVVPVRIMVHLGSSPGLLGSSASVKIRTA